MRAHAPKGSDIPDASVIHIAFQRLPVEASTGTAIASPSGMLCTAMAVITTALQYMAQEAHRIGNAMARQRMHYSCIK
jgi:hypothetical protein